MSPRAASPPHEQLEVMTNPEESVPSPKKSTLLLTLTLLGPQGVLRRERDQEKTSAASVFTSKHTGQGLVAHVCHSSTWVTRQEASLGYKTSTKLAKANYTTQSTSQRRGWSSGCGHNTSYPNPIPNGLVCSFETPSSVFLRNQNDKEVIFCDGIH